MIQPEEPEKKKGKSLIDRLPKLGRVSQLSLVVGVFLIVSVPLWVIYQQQPAKQAELKSTLANLENILETEETPKGKLEAELKKAEAEKEAAIAEFDDPDRSPEIIDNLIKLAELNDIDVTRTQVSTSKKILTAGKVKTEFSVLTFNISLKGQVPKFQNFLLALDDEFPTSEVKQVSIGVAADEGEEDTAHLIINVFCYEASE